MSKYSGLVQGELRTLRGDAMTGAVVKVFRAGTSTLATLYNKRVAIASAGGGDLLVNDATTGLPAAAGLLQPGLDSAANYTFYADSDEDYDAQVTWQGVTTTLRLSPVPAGVDVHERAAPRVDLYAHGVRAGGVDDMGPAIQAVLNAQGRAQYVLPPGVTRTNQRLDILEGQTLIPYATRASTLLAGAATAGLVRLRGSADCGADGVILDGGGINQVGVLSDTVSGTLTRGFVRNCLLKNMGNSACRLIYSIVDFDFTNNEMEDCTNGGFAAQDAVAINGLRIIGTRSRRVANVTIQVYIAPNAAPIYKNVVVADSQLRDFLGTQIPIELSGCIGPVAARNQVLSAGTRGISTRDCSDLLAMLNILHDQNMYAFEIGNSPGAAIIGNIARRCRGLVHETNGASDDVLIASNRYMGSGLSAPQTSAVIKLANASKRGVITDNAITDWQYLTEGAIRLGVNAAVQDFAVDGNRFWITDANTPHSAVAVRRAIGLSCSDNKVWVRRDLAAADDFTALFQPIIGDGTSADQSYTDNRVWYYGAVAAAPNASVYGNGNVGAGALAGLEFRRNTTKRGPRGFRLVVNSTDMIVENNDSRTCANADVIPATALPGTNADTSGATLAALETEVNELKALLRTAQILR